MRILETLGTDMSLYLFTFLRGHTFMPSIVVCMLLDMMVSGTRSMHMARIMRAGVCHCRFQSEMMAPRMGACEAFLGRYLSSKMV